MSFSLKDQIYNKEYVQRLGQALEKYYSKLKADDFVALAMKDWTKLELKERMRRLAETLRVTIPEDYPTSIALFKEVVAELPKDDFANMIFPDYVELYGLDDWETSMDALALFTQYGSSEFGIRPFIVQYQDQTMEQMNIWAHHENHHVRRLASEGSRPRLPWGMALNAFKKDPSPIIPILEQLKADPEDYVYRSVANNLNDISKDNPELVLELAEKWKGHHPHTDWAVKHALRTLFKKGNTRAMSLFGYGSPDAISLKNLRAQLPIKIGDQLHFSFEIVHQEAEPQQLRLEYAVEYLKKRGDHTRKVFKITENTYPSGSTLIERKQWFKDFSTRKHYPGEHRIAILVNGVEKGRFVFELGEA